MADVSEDQFKKIAERLGLDPTIGTSTKPDAEVAPSSTTGEEVQTPEQVMKNLFVGPAPAQEAPTLAPKSAQPAKEFNNLFSSGEQINLFAPPPAIKPVSGRNVPDSLASEDIDKFIDKQIKQDKENEDSFSFYRDIIVQLVGGGRDAAQNVSNLAERGLNFALSIADIGPVDIPDLPEVQESDRIAGQFIRSGVQFLTTFIPVLGIAGRIATGLKAASIGVTSSEVALSKLATIGVVEGSGVIAEQLAFDPRQPRLANLVVALAETSGEGISGDILNTIKPVADFLKADPNDTEAAARLKMSLESLGLGAVFGSVLKAVTRIKFGGGAKKVGKSSEVPDIEIKSSQPLEDAQAKLKDIKLSKTDQLTTQKDAKSVVDKEPLFQSIDKLEKTFTEFKLKVNELQKIKTADDAIKAIKETDLIYANPKEVEKLRKIKPKGPLVNKFNLALINVFDGARYFDLFQRLTFGVKGTPEALKKAVIKDKSKAVKGSKIGSVSRLPYFTASSMAARIQQAIGNFLEGTPVVPTKIDDTVAQMLPSGARSLKEILVDAAEKGEAENLLIYQSVIKAKLVSDRGINTIFENKLGKDGIEAIISKFQQVEGFPQLVSDMSQLTDSALDYLTAAGRLSKEQANAMKTASTAVIGDTQSTIFIPFYVEPTQLKQLIGKNRKSLGFSSSLKRLTGNEDLKLMNPIEALTRYFSKVVLDAEINFTKEAFYAPLEEAINKGVTIDGKTLDTIIARKIEGKELEGSLGLTSSILQALRKEIKEQIDGDNFDFDVSLLVKAKEKTSKALIDFELNKKTSKGLLNDVLKIFTFRNPIKTSDGRIFDIVYRDGEPVIFEILDEDLFNAFQSIGLTNSSDLITRTTAIGKVFSNINKIVRSSITLTPNFAVGNFLKDGLTGAVNSNFLFLPFYHPVKGFVDSFRDTAAYREFLSVAGFGTRRQVETLDIKSLELGRPLTKTGRQLQRIAKGLDESFFSKGVRGWQDFVIRLENATRFAEFELARKAGIDPFGAGVFAQEISVNFRRRAGIGTTLGQTIRATNDVSAFFNAGLQGFYRFGRRVKADPVKALTVGVFAYGAIDLGLYEISKAFPEYQELTDVNKDFNIHFPNPQDPEEFLNWIKAGMPRNQLPKLDEKSPLILIPRPFDVGQLSSVFTKIARSIDEQNGQILIDGMARIVGNLLPKFVAPTAVKPFIDLSRNKDFFDNPIIPDYMKSGDFLTIDMTKASTGETALKIAKLSQRFNETFLKKKGQFADALLNPIVVDYILTAYTAGILGIIKETSDLILRDTKLRGVKPASEADQRVISVDLIEGFISDFWRRFFSSESDFSKSATSYAELKKRVKQARKAFPNDLDTAYEQAIFLDRVDNPEFQALRSLTTIFAENDELIKVFRDEIDRISNSTTLSAQEKREMIDQNRKSIRLIKKEVLDTIENSPAFDVIYNGLQENTRTPKVE